MDLLARRQIADCLRVEIGCLALTPSVVDLLALLSQWEAGTVSGRPPERPAIDPSRDTGQHPA